MHLCGRDLSALHLLGRMSNGLEGTRYLFKALAKLPFARQQNVSPLHVSRGRNALQNELCEMKLWNDMEHAMQNDPELRSLTKLLNDLLSRKQLLMLEWLNFKLDASTNCGHFFEMRSDSVMTSSPSSSTGSSHRPAPLSAIARHFSTLRILVELLLIPLACMPQAQACENRDCEHGVCEHRVCEQRVGEHRVCLHNPVCDHGVCEHRI